MCVCVCVYELERERERERESRLNAFTHVEVISSFTAAELLLHLGEEHLIKLRFF